MDTHGEAAQRAEGHTRSCMCGLCKDKRATLIQLQVAENIRDLWSEISWVAGMDGWSPGWPVWLMEELAKKDRSVGWFASQLAHLSMASWCNKYHKWAEAKKKEGT